MGVLQDWQQRAAQADVNGALQLADQLVALQGQFRADTLQRVYSEVLLEALGRVQDLAQALQIVDRLARLPSQPCEIWEAAAESLVRAVSQPDSRGLPLSLVKMMADRNGYPASPSIQQSDS